MLMSVANKMNLHYNILQYLRGTFHVGSNIHIYIHGWLMIISYHSQIIQLGQIHLVKKPRMYHKLMHDKETVHKKHHKQYCHEKQSS